MRKVLADYGPHAGHIFNLGHGITPDIDPEQVTCLLEEVRLASQTASEEAASQTEK